MLLPEKMRRGRRYHPVATRRRRYFRPAASEFEFNFRRRSGKPNHLGAETDMRKRHA